VQIAADNTNRVKERNKYLEEELKRCESRLADESKLVDSLFRLTMASKDE
jgi:hypothetical protein